MDLVKHDKDPILDPSTFALANLLLEYVGLVAADPSRYLIPVQAALCCFFPVLDSQKLRLLVHGGTDMACEHSNLSPCA